MPKTHPLGFRVEPEIKAGLSRAAADDHRSVSSLIEKILLEWLRQHGYLVHEAAAPAAAAKAPSPRARKSRPGS